MALLVEVSSSPNPPPPPQLVKARNTPIRDYNGKSRHHHQETIISVEITIRKTSLMSHLKDKIAPYFKYYLIIIYIIKIHVRRAAVRGYSYFQLVCRFVDLYETS